MIDIEKLDKKYRMEVLRQISTYIREIVLSHPDKTLRNRYIRLIEDGRYFISIYYLHDIDYDMFNVREEDNLEDEDLVTGFATFEPLPGKGARDMTTIAGFIFDLTKDRPEHEQIRHCTVVMTKGVIPFKVEL